MSQVELQQQRLSSGCKAQTTKNGTAGQEERHDRLTRKLMIRLFEHMARKKNRETVKFAKNIYEPNEQSRKLPP